MNHRPESEKLFNQAKTLIPGGVSSPVRAFSAVGGTPVFMKSGKGSFIYDVDGNKYIDFVGSWGPMILGHARPEVIASVNQAVANSSSFGTPTLNEVLLAAEIIARVEPVERVRFVSSGTEAVMTAVRLARAATNRKIIVKFAGCYHGHTDSLLVQAGSGVATLGLPNSPGVTPGAVADTLVIAYNDLAALENLFTTRGDEIAAVITEAVPANMGVVPGLNSFNKSISQLCKKYGSLFILDEVMTGFRISRGGWWEANKSEGWSPDIFTFGKVIGGGFPLAALGGRVEVMNLLAPIGPVYQAGTLSGNPVASAAGLATLKLCDHDLYRRLDEYADQVGNGISQLFAKFGIDHQYQQEGNLFSFFFTPDPVRNFDDAKKQKSEFFAKFFHGALDAGIYLPPSAFEAWFVNGAMDNSVIDQVLTKVETVLANL